VLGGRAVDPVLVSGGLKRGHYGGGGWGGSAVVGGGEVAYQRHVARW
jgi:hypothetical protein